MRATQQTSLKTYMGLKETGKLGHRQRQIYNALLYKGSMNNTQLSKLLRLPISSITPRVRELVKDAMVVQGQKKPCPYTKRTTIFWKVNY